MVNIRRLTLFVAPVSDASPTTHVHVTNLFFESPAIGPLWMVFANAADTDMFFAGPPPYPANNMLDITAVHGTGMAFDMGKVIK